MVKNDIEKFRGTKEQDPSVWMYQFKLLATGKIWEEAEKKAMFGALLADKALIWHMTLAESGKLPDGWMDLEKIFLEKFEPSGVKDAMYFEYDNLKMHPNGLEDYILKFEYFVAKLKLSDEPSMIAKFINGLQPDLVQLTKITREQTLALAIDRARLVQATALANQPVAASGIFDSIPIFQAEAVRRSGRIQERKMQQSHAHHPYRRPDPTDKKRCYSCRELGHLARWCRAEFRDRY